MRPLVHLYLFDECLICRSNGDMRPDTTNTKRLGLADIKNKPE